MRRATLFLLAVSFVLVTFGAPGAAHAAPSAKAPAAAAQDAPAAAGGGLLARLLDWLVDFATGPAGDGEQPSASAQEDPSGVGGKGPGLDPEGAT